MARSGFEWAASFPDAAHRLIPNVVDELARDDPDRIVYELADADDVTKPFEKITARRYANAINRAAKWLQDILGKQDNTPTVGYLGPQDLRYLILVVATIKAGYKVLQCIV
jgi:acyl-CoA synthetase (AMP-forming)/AMP-acid ligase II